MNQCGGEILIHFWFKIPLQILYLWGLSAGVGLWSCLMPPVTLSAESHESTFLLSLEGLDVIAGCMTSVFYLEKKEYIHSWCNGVAFSCYVLFKLEKGVVCQMMTYALSINLSSLCLELANPAVFKKSCSRDIFNTINLYLFSWWMKWSSEGSFF